MLHLLLKCIIEHVTKIWSLNNVDCFSDVQRKRVYCLSVLPCPFREKLMIDIKLYKFDDTIEIRWTLSGFCNCEYPKLVYLWARSYFNNSLYYNNKYNIQYCNIQSLLPIFFAEISGSFHIGIIDCYRLFYGFTTQIEKLKYGKLRVSAIMVYDGAKMYYLTNI